MSQTVAAEALGIRQVAYRQENMGGAMADGYSRRSGRISVVAAQNGPAATLLVPPLAEALKASIPIVALVQDVERPQFDRNAFQDFRSPGVVSSVRQSSSPAAACCPPVRLRPSRRYRRRHIYRGLDHTNGQRRRR